MTVKLLPGDAVFELMDTHGIPLDVQVSWLRDTGFTHFDLGGFLEAAARSGNYTVEAIKARLGEAF